MQILITNINCLDDSFQMMDEERRRKTESLKMVADKKRSLASGYLQYQMCKKLGIQNPKYGYSENGKPYLEGYDNISFNISHSGEYAVLVYHESPNPIGIDIQQIRTLHEGMKKRILHEKEQIPANLTSEEEIVYLNRIWSIKESYVKMTGDGLALDFRKIRIDFKNGKIMAEDRNTAYFQEYHQLPGYAMAVCMTENSKMQITVQN